MAHKLRSVPATWAQVAPTMGVKRLCEHYRTNCRAIKRWADETGIKPMGSRYDPMQDAPEGFKQVAPTMSFNALTKHYGVGRTKLERWLAEHGVQPKYVGGICVLRPVPDDFIANAPTMTRADGSRRWNTGYDILARWSEETGVKFMTLSRQAMRSKHFSLAPTGGRGTNFTHTKASSIYDLAADEIRRQRFAVHRCDERGRYQEGGRFWRVGQIVLTPEELLERAERYRAREMAA